MKTIKFARPKLTRMSLEEFAQEHELTMAVVERSEEDIRWINSHSGNGRKFYVYFQMFDLLVREGVWTSASGDGDTELEAIADLAGQISGRKAKYGSLRIDVPQLYV